MDSQPLCHPIVDLHPQPRLASGPTQHQFLQELTVTAVVSSHREGLLAWFSIWERSCCECWQRARASHPRHPSPPSVCYTPMHLSISVCKALIAKYKPGASVPLSETLETCLETLEPCSESSEAWLKGLDFGIGSQVSNIVSQVWG